MLQKSSLNDILLNIALSQISMDLKGGGEDGVSGKVLVNCVIFLHNSVF